MCINRLAVCLTWFVMNGCFSFKSVIISTLGNKKSKTAETF